MDEFDEIERAARTINDVIDFNQGVIEIIENDSSFHKIGALLSQLLIKLRPEVKNMPASAQSYFNVIGALADALLQTKSNDPEIIGGLIIDRLHMVTAMQRNAYIKWCEAREVEPAEL